MLHRHPVVHFLWIPFPFVSTPTHSLESRLNSTSHASDNLVYVNSSEVQVVTGNKTFLDDVSMYNATAKESKNCLSHSFYASLMFEWSIHFSSRNWTFSKLFRTGELAFNVMWIWEDTVKDFSTFTSYFLFQSMSEKPFLARMLPYT